MITSEFYKLTEKLVWKASEGYYDEGYRKKALLPILSKMLGTIISVGYGINNMTASDGVIITELSKGTIVYRGILEIKNEIGTGGADPSIQSAMY